MALNRGKLSNVTQVAAGTTSAVVTVAGNKKVYVKSIIVHDGSNIGSVGVANTAHVYFVPNNGGSVGAAASTNRIFNVDVSARETVLLEPSYPIVLESTNDTLQVGNVGAGVFNILVNGDKEV